MIVDWSEAPEWANYLAVSELGHSTWCELMPRLCETRNNWEGGGRWKISNLKLADQSTRLVQKSSAWTGEGRPPVGAVCVLRTKRATAEGGWMDAEIMYSSQTAVVWRWEGRKEEFGSEWNDVEFRPIRTPEQIAADEREAKAKAMYLSIYYGESVASWDSKPDSQRETFRKAIDAGWQQVLP